MYTAPGIAVTTVQGKEITAEREMLEALEEAADELYPEESKEEDEEDGDIEDMLKRELEGMNQKQVQKSTRFRVCKREAPCGELRSRERATDTSLLHHRSGAAGPVEARPLRSRKGREDRQVQLPLCSAHCPLPCCR